MYTYVFIYIHIFTIGTESGLKSRSLKFGSGSRLCLKCLEVLVFGQSFGLFWDFPFWSRLSSLPFSGLRLTEMDVGVPKSLGGLAMQKWGGLVESMFFLEGVEDENGHHPASLL